jgi:hypothetical protein
VARRPGKKRKITESTPGAADKFGDIRVESERDGEGEEWRGMERKLRTRIYTQP